MNVYKPVAKVGDAQKPFAIALPRRQSPRLTWQLVQYAICIFVLGALAVASARCIFRVFASSSSGASDAHSSLWSDLFAPAATRSDDFTLPELLGELPVDHVAEFEEFLRQMSKNYSSDAERWRRFVVFAENQRQIAAHQKRARNTVFGLTRFADLNDEELQKFLQPHSYVEPSHAQRETLKMDTAAPPPSPPWSPLRPPFSGRRPRSFDWRTKGAVMGIKDQVTAVVESLNIIAGGRRVRLSEQQLIDCDGRNHACFGGYRPFAFEYVRREGQLSDANYAYAGQQGACRSLNESRVRVDEIYAFNRLDEEEIATWVAERGPVTIGINVTKEMFAYRGGIFDPSDADCAHRSLGSHAMAIVGYGELNGEQFWLLKNSWGPAHGLAGYIRMKRGVNSCGIANSAFTALITKTWPPQF